MNQRPHFVSVSPAFNGGNDGKISTPARICFNLSKVDRVTKESQNDLTLLGKVNLDISKTAQYFRSNSAMAIGDIRKFFQMVFVSECDLSKQMFVWRKDCNPNNPVEILLMTRLMFGSTAASSIARTSLDKILEMGGNFMQTLQW